MKPGPLWSTHPKQSTDSSAAQLCPRRRAWRQQTAHLEHPPARRHGGSEGDAQHGLLCRLGRGASSTLTTAVSGRKAHGLRGTSGRSAEQQPGLWSGATLPAAWTRTLHMQPCALGTASSPTTSDHTSKTARGWAHPSATHQTKEALRLSSCRLEPRVTGHHAAAAFWPLSAATWGPLKGRARRKSPRLVNRQQTQERALECGCSPCLGVAGPCHPGLPVPQPRAGPLRRLPECLPRTTWKSLTGS